MKEVIDVDVLIVGAGPAGSSAARAAAEAGASVLVIEKRARIGEPVRCAEYIPRLLAQQVKVSREIIAQGTEGIVTFMPDGKVLRKTAPGFILNRGKFDQALAAQAEMAGARIQTATRAVSKAGHRVLAVGPSGGEEIRAKVIIGADGPDSTVGSWIGQKNNKIMWAVQQTVKLKQPAQDTEGRSTLPGSIREDMPGSFPRVNLPTWGLECRENWAATQKLPSRPLGRR